MPSHDAESTLDRLSDLIVHHNFPAPDVWARAFADLGRLDDAELDRLAQHVPAGR